MQSPQEDDGHARRNRLAIKTGIAMGLLAIVFVLTPTVLFLLNPHYHGSIAWDKPAVADFSLPRADGQTFRLSSFKGRIVVLYFGYTTCPDVCPATLYNLTRMMKSLGDQSKQISVVFITVDPTTDTPGKMTEYLKAFDPDFIGLTGTVAQLQPVYDQFQVTILRADQGQAVSSTGIGHTTSLFVIDRLGRLRVELHEGDTAQGITNDIQNLLNESS